LIEEPPALDTELAPVPSFHRFNQMAIASLSGLADLNSTRAVPTLEADFVLPTLCLLSNG